jgi:hypothetical protein
VLTTRCLPIFCLVCLIAIAISSCRVNLKQAIPTYNIIHVDAHYVYPGRNEFSTYERFYKKEIDTGHFAETQCQLDPGQQLLVLNKAIVLHFYQMPDTFYHSDHTTMGQPHSLRIWADTLDKTVHWFGSIDSLHPVNYDLKGLMLYVDSIVKSTDDYQGLPKSKLTDD